MLRYCINSSEKVKNIDGIYHKELQMSSNRELELKRISRIFNALGNETRVRILLLINKTKRPLHIKAIAEALKLDYAALYRHVKVLQNSGLLVVYDVGRSRVLSLKNKESTEQLLQIANNILQ
jgi:DNA-binding transcriptional ArsR family regulator